MYLHLCWKEDIQQLTSILSKFGDVTGLVTNLEKSSVTPISCNGIDLDILEYLPATRANFPMLYLGPPLSVHRLKKNVKEIYPRGNKSYYLFPYFMINFYYSC